MAERMMVKGEFRADDAGKVITGHAAVYDQQSDMLGGWFVEVVKPGAFADTLREDVRCLFNHDPSLILGRTRSRTLRLFDDANKGLRIECDMPETTLAKDLMVSIRRGDVDQMSFAFETIEDRWTWSKDPNKPTLRELLKVKLFDVSPVTYPAYPQTDVAARANKMLDEKRAVYEAALRKRDAGDAFDANRRAMLELELAD